MPKFCTRDVILNAADHKIEQVPTPEWGGDGFVTGVRTFDAATRAELLQLTANDNGMPDDWMENVVAAAACDEKGNLLFKKEDIKKLSFKNAVVLERLFVAAIELNGLSETSVDKIKGELKPTPR